MKISFVTISLLAIFVLTGCKKDKISPGENLITNSGFESNGQQDFQGWIGMQSFSNDVPSDGGKWSLKLEPVWYPGEGFAETFITSFSGNYIFKLSCETKSIHNLIGTISLRKQNQNGTITDLAKSTFTDSIWKEVTLTINVSLHQTDKLIVHLSAGSSELSVSGTSVLFDKVKLKTVR